jgi:hypothetical protein
MLYLVGGLPETRGESGSYMHSTLVGLDIPRLRVARTRHDRQMSMGDAGPGAVPVWSKVPTAWSHGGDQTKTEPAPWSMDDHARYRQGMEICRAGACGEDTFLRAAHESLPTPHGD